MDRFRFTEKSSGGIDFAIKDQDDVAVPAASLTAATLTLHDLDTYEPDSSPAVGIINSRDAQDILNANDVTIDSSGHVIWSVRPEDNPIVTRRRQLERHRAKFQFVWATGAFNYECELEVLNLRSVP